MGALLLVLLAGALGAEAVPSADARLANPRHTDTVFAARDFESLAAWEEFAAQQRQRILLACGLWPMPEKTPLNARIFGRIQHEDYSVEKVYFEAAPGLLVTGNLYRPVGAGPFPGVLNPHGHWKHGRLENTETCSVPGRCITFARMGMVAFSYDMMGYNDSVQFKHNWGSRELSSWGLHPFGLQLLSSIRALDFLESLPEVDRDRLACTGASGGGTQTFALYAVDDRVKAAAPVNMISSTMQGGCVCENAPLLRLACSNMEIGAMMAPRPLLLVSATGDWTKLTPTVEYPAIRRIYALYGAEEKVEAVQFDAGHNFNRDSREAVYRFFGKHLLGGDWSDFTEPPFAVEAEADLRVFPDGKLPEGFKGQEEWLQEEIARRKARAETFVASAAFSREEKRAALALLLHATLPGPEEVTIHEAARAEESAGCTLRSLIVSRRSVGDRIPAALFLPKRSPVLLELVEKGEDFEELKRRLMSEAGTDVAGGRAVAVMESFRHGTAKETPRETKGAFSDTFEPTDTMCRVQDVLTVAAAVRGLAGLAGETPLVVAASEETQAWQLLAVAVGAVGRIEGLAPEARADWGGRDYVPALRAIGDQALALHLMGR